jgi:general secretion pathway protein E/type IV pilus assembly protein PilB
MGVEPFLIASSVRAFLAQRLVRTLCEACRRPANLDEAYLRQVGFPLEKKTGIFEAAGCRSCRSTGYRGRMAIVEICLVTQPMQELITAHAPYSQLRAQAFADGMTTLRDYGWQKVAEGRTTIEEVLTNTASE